MIRAKIPGAVISLTAVVGSVLLIAGFMLPGIILWGCGYALLLWRQVKELRYRNWQNHVVTQVATRISFSFGIAGPLIHLPGNWVILSLTALTITVFMVRFSRAIFEIARSLPFDVNNLRGAELPQLNHALLTSLVLSTLLLPVILMTLAMLSFTGILLATVTGLVACLALLALRDALRKRREGEAIYLKLHHLLDEYEPKFLVYWAAPANSAYQLKMWQPYLERLGEKFAVVVRNRVSFPEAIDAFPNHPVVFARSLNAIDEILPSSVVAVFYVNNADRNVHMVRYNDLTHIQLLHGDSEKASSYNPVTAMFDRIYVAGQAAIDRYEKNQVFIPKEKFAIIGRPQVEEVRREDSLIESKQQPSLLYAPTWSGYFNDSTYTSLLVIKPLLQEALTRGCRIIFRPHPYSRGDKLLSQAIDEIHELLADHQSRTGIPHLFGEIAEQKMTINECFNASDAMVADVSSVISDYLYSGKPLGLMTGASSPEELIKQLPLAKGAYIFRGQDTESWRAALDAMLGTDPFREVRKEMRSYYLGDIPGDDYASAFLNTARADLLSSVRNHR